jgi:hypothetical protein
VRISGSSGQHLFPSVREAKEKARDKLHKHATAKPLLVPATELTLSIVEPPHLAATRRTILLTDVAMPAEGADANRQIELTIGQKQTSSLRLSSSAPHATMPPVRHL